MPTKTLQVMAAIMLSIFAATLSEAVGGANIGNEVPSARAAGQGYVGVAGQNEDPSVVYQNPAAMTSLKGTQITVGAHWENIHGSYESDAGAVTKAKVTNIAVPNLSLTQNFLDGKLGAGLSVQSPFGLETHWPGNSPLRYTATDTRLGIVEIMPAVAYQVHPKISIGAGIKYVNLFNAQMDRHLNVDAMNLGLSAPPTGAPDAVSSLRGQATDWGYHAGMVFQPYEKHSVGVTYHSKINLRINGNVTIRGLDGTVETLFGGSDYSTSAYTDLILPQNVQFGYAYKPNEKWLLEADAAWFNWSQGTDLNVRYSETDPNRLALLDTGNPTVFDLRDVWSVAAGANYKVSDRWQLRSGLWYEPWATPEVNFSPAFNDLTRYGLSFGTGYQLTQNLTLDAAYSAVFFHNRSIHNSVGSTTSGIPDGGIPAFGVPSPDIDGTYKDYANLVALNLTYRFGRK